MAGCALSHFNPQFQKSKSLMKGGKKKNFATLNFVSVGQCFIYRETASAASDSLVANGEESMERILELERELNAARSSIAEKEAKCNRLSELQDHIDSEVQELTEKLFQEAYKMVNEAEERRSKAEKLLAESRLKVDMLTAEVEALKIIVKSPSAQIHKSTPPQKNSLTSRFLTPSRKEKHTNSTNARKSLSLPAAARDAVSVQSEEHKQDTAFEVDPIYHREFANWRESGAPLDEESPFLSRVMAEEVAPCLHFNNTELAMQVLSAIKTNTLELEPVKETKPTVRTCALSNVPRFCPYRLRVVGDAEWCFISMLARNRIASVCDFFTYMRYVNQGIVKSGIHDSYWDVINLRKNMALARLGLGFVPKTGGARAEIR
uniref:Guanine nucleotide exchange factor for Rab-3A n=1 Tax=Ascaris lumbricoides TaxID=6252 RepID=A0A0M3HTC0_ASCLU